MIEKADIQEFAEWFKTNTSLIALTSGIKGVYTLKPGSLYNPRIHLFVVVEVDTHTRLHRNTVNKEFMCSIQRKDLCFITVGIGEKAFVQIFNEYLYNSELTLILHAELHGTA